MLASSRRRQAVLPVTTSSATDGRPDMARRRRTVRRKLLVVVIVTTGLALLAAAVAITIYDLRIARHAFLANLDTHASILSLSTAPALAFDDRETAQRDLEALSAGPSIVSAALYVDGRRYASYAQRPRDVLPETLPPQRIDERGGRALVEVRTPVVQSGETLGWLVLRADYDVRERVQTYLAIVALVTVLSLVLAAVLSQRLHGEVVGPLEEMSVVAREVVARRDYSLRARRSTDDEIGVVVDAFNAMLEEVEQRSRALRESERTYRAIGETIAYGIWINDPTGRNLYASDSFLQLTGLTQEECSGAGWARALHPDERDATLRAWRECVEAGTAWYREHRILGVDGRWHPVLAQGVPIRDDDGRIVRWAGINLDVAQIKRNEEALRDADRRKDEFLATLAHELRNPLAPIRHAVRMLDSPAADEAHRRWGRDVIARQVQRMALLLDDLLDVARITRRQLVLRRQRAELATIVSTAVETAQPLVEAKQHALRVSMPPEPIAIDVDPLRLSQAISNLLTNAAKYTDNRGNIALDATVGPDGLRISVRDDGIGIAADAVPRLFEMFSQVDTATDRAEGGLGIGLALVKGLVELHGGSVEAHSAGAGKGSEFIITLPASTLLAATAESDVAPEVRPGHAASGCRVLVADDNRDAADSLRAVLRLGGHDVCVAYSGEEALALGATHQPEVAILDIGMPDMDGYETARRVREAPWGRDALLVALTGWGQEADKRRARAAGFDLHYTKPVAIEEVERLLGAERERRATRG